MDTYFTSGFSRGQIDLHTQMVQDTIVMSLCIQYCLLQHVLSQLERKVFPLRSWRSLSNNGFDPSRSRDHREREISSVAPLHTGRSSTYICMFFVSHDYGEYVEQRVSEVHRVCELYGF